MRFGDAVDSMRPSVPTANKVRCSLGVLLLVLGLGKTGGLFISDINWNMGDLVLIWVPHSMVFVIAALVEMTKIQSGNSGYSNIAGVFLSRGIEDASQSQLLLDAMTYVAFKTYAEEELEEDIRHSAGIRKRLDAEFGAGVGDEYAKAAAETVSQLTQVLDAYNSVYQRRMTRHLGAAGEDIMEALGQLKLNNVNILEVGVPCN